MGGSEIASVVAGLAAAAAGGVGLAPTPLWRPSTTVVSPDMPTAACASTPDERGLLHRWRLLWALVVGAGAAAFVSGPAGVPSGGVAALLAWAWIGRLEPPAVARRREAARRELPALVQLLVTALESGSDVATAVRVVCEAMPGAAASLLEEVPVRLALGVHPETAWRPVVDHDALAPLGRTMVRAHRSGSSVTTEVSRLARDLEDDARLRVDERARAVGVKAAVPLGLCLLSSFLVIGVVPLVAGLLGSLSL